MSIVIEPNYELFVQIWFVLWVLKGILNIRFGLSKAERKTSDKYGGNEIIVGIITIVLTIWILA